MSDERGCAALAAAARPGKFPRWQNHPLPKTINYHPLLPAAINYHPTTWPPTTKDGPAASNDRITLERVVPGAEMGGFHVGERRTQKAGFRGADIETRSSCEKSLSRQTGRQGEGKRGHFLN